MTRPPQLAEAPPVVLSRTYRRPGHHETRVDADSTRRVEDSTASFWLAMFRGTFGVFVGESLAVAVYVFDTPDGTHRFALGVVAAVSIFSASTTTLMLPWIARRHWRELFSLAWTLASGAVLTITVWLDGGLRSPLLFLILLPVAYAGLMFRPRAAAACAGISLGELGIIAATDRATTPQGDTLLIIAAVTAGLGVLAWLSSLQRARLDRRFADLTRDLEVQAATDHLTGCVNHRAFSDRVDEEIDRALRHGHPMSLVVADIDDFKHVNDTYGHPAGDDALERAGATLRERSRRSDIVGRIGGDEFALLLPGIGLEAAARYAQRVFNPYDAGVGSLTFSAGVATLDLAEPTADRLFHDADHSMYFIKRAGGGGVAIATGSGPPKQLHVDFEPGLA